MAREPWLPPRQPRPLSRAMWFPDSGLDPRAARHLLHARLVTREEGEPRRLVEQREELAVAHGAEAQARELHVVDLAGERVFEAEALRAAEVDRKSTRLNSSHSQISYAV